MTKKSLSDKANKVDSFFTSPFGLFALIADPKVVVAETTNSTEKKMKLKWFMLTFATACSKKNSLFASLHQMIYTIQNFL